MSQAVEPSDEHYRLFGQLLVAWRERRGLTQQAAARRKGAPSDTTLSAIEAGRWRTQSDRGNVTLRKLDAAMGWPPGVSRTLLLESSTEALRDDDFVDAVFAELETSFTEYGLVTGGIPGLPVTETHSLDEERRAAVAAIASALPSLRLGDLAAVAVVVRSLIPPNAGGLDQLNRLVHRAGEFNDRESATDSVSVGGSAGTRRPVARVAEMIAAHEEAHAIEDEQLGDDSP